MMNKHAIAVMASGKGSNLEVILQESAAGRCPVDVKLVISDRKEAKALEIARLAGVHTVLHINPRDYANRAAYDQACADAIADANCQWIVLAGYMRILSSTFVTRFSGKIINIHPSILPAFPGGKAVEDALNHGVKVAGCTVHLVDEVLDGGAILAQATVPVENHDTQEKLHARIQEQEHQLYPGTLTRMVRDGFHIEGRRAIWHDHPS